MTNQINISQREWTMESQGTYSIVIAVKRILSGETVSFDCYIRDKKDPTKMNLQSIVYFGICDLDGRPAFRVSPNKDLESVGSHSLISSWHKSETVKEGIYMAALMAVYLRLEYTDFFIN